MLHSETETGSVRKCRAGCAQCCDDPWRDVMNSKMYRELELPAGSKLLTKHYFVAARHAANP